MNNNYLKPEAKLVKVEAEERIMSNSDNPYFDSSWEIGDDEEEGI